MLKTAISHLAPIPNSSGLPYSFTLARLLLAEAIQKPDDG
jgi:hypothetical protein